MMPPGGQRSPLAPRYYNDTLARQAHYNDCCQRCGAHRFDCQTAATREQPVRRRVMLAIALALTACGSVDSYRSSTTCVTTTPVVRELELRCLWRQTLLTCRRVSVLRDEWTCTGQPTEAR